MPALGSSSSSGWTEEASGLLAGVSEALGGARDALLAVDPEALTKEQKMALISTAANHVHQERKEKAEREAREACERAEREAFERAEAQRFAELRALATSLREHDEAEAPPPPPASPPSEDTLGELPPAQPQAAVRPWKRVSKEASEIQPLDDETLAMQRAQLSAIQGHSSSFRGFSEEELDELFPLLAFIEFDHGDPIMKCGEEASWAGILLSGALEAVAPGGAVLGQVHRGAIVGEMSLFRGGKRGCDMRATSTGTIAVLRYIVMDRLADANLLHKLTLVFGKEAYLHTLFPQT
jgi:hypothetical protein